MGPWAAILGVVAAVWLTDRATKSIALGCLDRDGERQGLLRLSISQRLPLAGELSKANLVALWLGAAMCALVAAALAPALRLDWLFVAGLAAAVAGAASNLSDLIWRGAVVDFVSIGWWPVFNLADVAIVLGGTLAILALL
jgi:signal peptidase II